MQGTGVREAEVAMAYAPCSRSLNRLLVAGMLLTLAASLPATADDPQQAPPAPTATAVPGSLAAAAGGLRLQPAAETGTGSLVITNQNLKAPGAGAAVSQGAVVVAPAPESGGAPQATAAAAPPGANDLAVQLLQQQARVDDLTTRLQDMDKQLAAPSPDPHYPKVDFAPQFRAPGVVDPARGQRDALEAELEAERGKLEALRKQAAASGVTITKVANEAPTPTS
jgi:hypothetical protein